MRAFSVKTALLAAGLAAGMLCGTGLPATAQAQGYYYVPQRFGPPPPPRHEFSPRHRHGWVWVPGHYHWRHRLQRYVWVRGYWVRNRPGYVYMAPIWEQDGDRWRYRPLRWDRHGPPPPPPRRGYYR